MTIDKGTWVAISGHPGLSRHTVTRQIKARYWAGGRQHAKTFAGNELRRAEAWRRERMGEVDKGTHIDLGNKITVAEYAHESIDARLVSDSTRKRLLSMIENHLDAHPLGSRALVKVRPTEIESWLTSRRAVASPGYLLSLSTLVKGIFARAAHDRIIGASPWPRVRLARPRSRGVALIQAQLSALFDELPDRYRAVSMTQAMVGTRLGETFALRVADVEFLRIPGKITIQDQLDEHGNRRGNLKSRAPGERRVLELPETLKIALAEHLRKYPSDDLIFTQPDGSPMIAGSYRRGIFNPARDRAGLTGVRPHDLRHTFGSVLVRDGWDVVEIAEAMGNTPAVVMRDYAHLLADRRRSLARSIDAAFRVPDVSTEASDGR